MSSQVRLPLIGATDNPSPVGSGVVKGVDAILVFSGFKVEALVVEAVACSAMGEGVWGEGGGCGVEVVASP